jgi:hypothetical protein
MTMTIDLQGMLIKSLVAFDSQRDRSQQVEVGPSAIGGCRRQVYHILKESPKINTDTEPLASILGTFIHAGIAEAIKREDPFGDNFIIEQEVTFGNLKGHVDLFIKDQGLVVDWKTTKKTSLRYFPKMQQRMQVQVYGYLLAQNGHEVKHVSLVAIPRDGVMNEIRAHVEPYDEALALEGLAWLNELRALVALNGPAPEPTERLNFCASYCDYYDPTGEVGCPSTQK